MTSSSVGNTKIKVKFTKRSPEADRDVKIKTEKTAGTKRKADDDAISLGADAPSSTMHQNNTTKKKRTTKSPTPLTSKPPTIKTEDEPKAPPAPKMKTTRRAVDNLQPPPPDATLAQISSPKPITLSSTPVDFLPQHIFQNEESTLDKQFDDFWNEDSWLDLPDWPNFAEECEFEKMVEYEWMYCNDALEIDDVIDFNL